MVGARGRTLGVRTSDVCRGSGLMEGDLGTKSVSAQKLVHGNPGSHIPPGKSTPHKKRCVSHGCDSGDRWDKLCLLSSDINSLLQGWGFAHNDLFLE